MGYYTNFQLSAQKYSDLLNEPISDGLTEAMGEYISKDEYMSYALEPDGSPNNDCKWYDYAEFMIKMSKTFPDYLFTLNGRGEENGDIWRAFYKNGKTYMEKAKMVFTSEKIEDDPFDPELLQ